MLKWFKNPFPLRICIFLLASILLADRLLVVVSAGGSGSSKLGVQASSSSPAHSSIPQNPPRARITSSGRNKFVTSFSRNRNQPFPCDSPAYSRCVPNGKTPSARATSIYKRGGRIGG